MNQPGERSSAMAGAVQHRSLCRVCSNGCPILVEVEGGRVVKVAGDPDGPVHHGYSCHRGRALPELMNGPQRLLHAQKKQPDGSHAAISSEQAIDEITERLQDVIERHGPESVAMYVGMGITKSVPLLPLADSLMDGLGASKRWSGNTLDQPGKQIAHGLHGYWLAPPQAFDAPEVILWIGINPLMTYTGLPRGDPSDFFKECRKRQTTIVVIDPRRTETARRATRHIQPRPGEDVAIVAGMLRVILDEELYDHEFVADNVDGLDALRAGVRPFTPEYVAERAETSVEDLVWAARTFAGAKRGYTVAGTGPHMGTARGTLFEYLVLALDTICGHYLRAGEIVRTPGTLAPTPTFRAQASSPVPGWGFGPKLRFRGFTETLGGLPVAVMAEEILTPGEGQVRALFSVGGNPAVSVTDQLQMIEALTSLELLVTTDVVMSATARLAHYVMAPTMQAEVPGMIGDSPANFYGNAYAGYRDATAQYAPAIVAPPPGSDVIEEWRLYYGIAQRMGMQLRLNAPRIFVDRPQPKERREGPPIDMVSVTTDEIIEIITAAGRVPLAEVKRHPSGALFPPAAPVVVQPKDPGWEQRLDVGNDQMMSDLADVLARDDIAVSIADGFEFRLLCRRMHQLNSSLRIPAIDRGRPFNPAFMHPDDLARLELRDRDLVEITSARASIPAVVMTDTSLRVGTVSMAHSFGDAPECDAMVREIGSCTNRLLSNDQVYEPYSGQPLMSNVPVNVRKVVGA